MSLRSRVRDDFPHGWWRSTSWWWIGIKDLGFWITVCLLTFIDKWNDFQGPLIYIQDQTLFPLARAAQVFQASHKLDWAQSMSAAVLISLPLVLLYFFAQRKFIEGITLTGQKG